MARYDIYEEMLLELGVISLDQCLHYTPPESCMKIPQTHSSPTRHEQLTESGGRFRLEPEYQLTFGELVRARHAQRKPEKYKRQTYFSQLLNHLTCTPSQKKADDTWDPDIVRRLRPAFNPRDPVRSTRSFLKANHLHKLYPCIYRILRDFTGQMLIITPVQRQRLMRLFTHFCAHVDKDNDGRTALPSYNMVLLEMLDMENIYIPFKPLLIGSRVKREQLDAKIKLLMPQAIKTCNAEEAKNMHYFGCVTAPTMDKASGFHDDIFNSSMY